MSSIKEDFIDDIFDELKENNVSTSSIVYKKHYSAPVQKADVADILGGKKRHAEDTKDDLWELNQTYQARKRQRVLPEIIVPFLKTAVTTCDIKHEGVRLISGGFGPTNDGQHTFKFSPPPKFQRKSEADQSGARTDYMVNAITSSLKKRRIFKAHGEEYRVVDNKVVIRQTGLPYHCEGVFIRYGKKLGRLTKLLPDETLETWYNRIYAMDTLCEKFQTFIPLLFNLRLTAEAIYKCFLNMLCVHGYEKRDIPFAIFQRLRIHLNLHVYPKAIEAPVVPRKLKLARKARTEHYRTHWDYGLAYFDACGSNVLKQRAVLPVIPPSENAFLNRIRQNEILQVSPEGHSQPPEKNTKPFLVPIKKAPRMTSDIGHLLSVFLHQGDHGSYTKMIDTYEKIGYVVRNAGKFYTLAADGQSLDTFLCCQHEYAMYKNADETTYAMKRGSQTICKFCNTELTPAHDEITYDANGQANITSQDMFVRGNYLKIPVDYPELQLYLTNFYNTFTDYTQHLDKDAILLAVYHYLQKYYSDTLKETIPIPLPAENDSAFLKTFTPKERETLGLVPFPLESREHIKAQIKVSQLRRNFIRAGVLCAFVACPLPEVSTLLTYLKIDLSLDTIHSMGVKWNEFRSAEELLRGVYERTCIYTGFIPEPVVNTICAQMNYPLKQGQTEKIPFTEAVNRIASGTGCKNETVLVGYATPEYILYQMPQTTKPQRNVAQTYIKLLQHYAENMALFRLPDVEPLEPVEPECLTVTRKWEPVKTRNGGLPYTASTHFYSANMRDLEVDVKQDVVLDLDLDLDIDKKIAELSMKLNLKFINQLDEIPLWVSHQLDEHRETVNDVDLMATLQQLTGRAPTVNLSTSEADLKVQKLQTIGKELLYHHVACSDRPDLRLKAYRSFWPEIYSYDKAKLESLAKSKKCSSSYLLKLVLQTDVLFHAAKISQKLADDRLPDMALLHYFSPKENNPYLRFISDLLSRRLTENNHTIIEYDRYKKWFTQIKAPRIIRTIVEEAAEEDPEEEEDNDDAPIIPPGDREGEEEEILYDPDIEEDE